VATGLAAVCAGCCWALVGAGAYFPVGAGLAGEPFTGAPLTGAPLTGEPLAAVAVVVGLA